MKSILVLLFLISICNGFITYPITIRYNPKQIKMNLFNTSEAHSDQKYVVKFIGLNIYQIIIIKHFHIYFPVSYLLADFLYNQTLELIMKFKNKKL
jgi:hypothetical protein